jgi:hypothetical protein
MSDYFNKTTQRYIPDDFIFTLAAVRTWNLTNPATTT